MREERKVVQQHRDRAVGEEHATRLGVAQHTFVNVKRRARELVPLGRIYRLAEAYNIFFAVALVDAHTRVFGSGDPHNII